MAKKNRGGGGGGGAPDWLVTFADLMSLLVVFFVLIISFSVQDQEKIQIVTGSVKHAFGVQKESKKYGVIEVPGLPERDFLRFVTQRPSENISVADGQETKHNDQLQKPRPTYASEQSETPSDPNMALAAATLRQAWQSMPDIAEMANNILVEETPEGLNVELIDQDGRPMFAEGSKYPFDYTQKLLSRMAPVLRKLPNRIQITGHTTEGLLGKGFDYTNWELSSDRANVVRRIFTSNGLSPSKLHSVQGKAANDPLFPNDPTLPANSRISILIIKENPVAPLGLKP